MYPLQHQSIYLGSGIRPGQSPAMTTQLGVAQTNGLDITTLLNLMMPMMIVVMMMGMMTQAMGSATA